MGAYTVQNYGEMLTDPRRMDAYERAIHAACRPAATVLRIDAQEHEQGSLSDATKQTALSAMRRDGFVQVDDVLSRDHAALLQTEYFERYGRLHPSDLDGRALLVGDNRYMITIDVAGAFNDPLLYVNPFFFPVVKQILGGDAVLDSFGVVCAFPGAPAQHIHVDHGPLFPDSPLDMMVPCFAVTVVLPLVDLDASTGATAVWPGTHRERWVGQPYPNSERAYVPEVGLGSVYLMDYRIVHSGRPNTTERPRPILYMIYSRPWFTDRANHKLQERIRISPEERAAVPEEYRPLFAHASLR